MINLINARRIFMKKLQLCTLALLLSLPHTTKTSNNDNIIAGCVIAGLATVIGGLGYLLIKADREDFINRTIQKSQSSITSAQHLQQELNPFVKRHASEYDLAQLASHIQQTTSFSKKCSFIKETQQYLEKNAKNLSSIKPTETQVNTVQLKQQCLEEKNALASIITFLENHSIYFSTNELIQKVQQHYAQELQATSADALVAIALTKGLKHGQYPLGLIEYQKLLTRDTDTVNTTSISSYHYPALASRLESLKRYINAMHTTITVSHPMMEAQRAYQEYQAEQRRLAAERERNRIEQEKAAAAQRLARAEERKAMAKEEENRIKRDELRILKQKIAFQIQEKDRELEQTKRSLASLKSEYDYTYDYARRDTIRSEMQRLELKINQLKVEIQQLRGQEQQAEFNINITIGL